MDPVRGDVTSIGCVLHARTVRGREGSLDALYDDMIARCRRVAEGLRGARRITPVRSAANFSYRTTPVVGDRFLCVGDAVAFVDPDLLLRRLHRDADGRAGGRRRSWRRSPTAASRPAASTATSAGSGAA